ncbi:hypothetical protein R2F61_07450 [Mollicutes bacterium LVI A0078]|nr:hypothetical protein RZE84_07225 [Mollicutes bacterium LVI A0075]WOO90559.1 hypothetical protein R2F61_07450 [Mollicutes bacterium LVI A0078]
MNVNDLMKMPRELRLENLASYTVAIDYVLEMKEVSYPFERVHMLIQIESCLTRDLEYLVRSKKDDRDEKLKSLLEIKDKIFKEGNIINKIQYQDVVLRELN